MWIIAYPIARLLDWILGSKHGITYRRAELKELVAMHGEDQAGPLNQDEVSILRAVLELRDKSVKNVMTTLEHVYMLPLEAKLDKDTMTSVCADACFDCSQNDSDTCKTVADPSWPFSRTCL